MLSNKIPMQAIELLVSVKGSAGTFSHTVAGGFPTKNNPNWIKLDGNSDEEFLTKIFTDALAAYVFSMEDGSEACDKLRENIKTRTDFLNKVSENLS